MVENVLFIKISFDLNKYFYKMIPSQEGDNRCRVEKKDKSKRPIESYEHSDKQRLNNPPAGLVTPDTDPEVSDHKKTYTYDPHLGPQLIWAGKSEHTSFEVPTVSLHVDERIDPRTII